MKIFKFIFLASMTTLMLGACVSKKKFLAISELSDQHQERFAQCNSDLHRLTKSLASCQQERDRLAVQMEGSKEISQIHLDQIADLRARLIDMRKLRDQQLTQVGDLTVLSQSANDNVKETLTQLDDKDKYLRFIQAAKTKADSINLALAVNLQGVLRDGIEDQDIQVQVDKTVVFINLSDRMLYLSGSSNLTPGAQEVLGKIAKIIESRPEFEVMVEGYTDNVPITNACTKDNWDLSVKRATAVVRVLQNNYGIDPNRLIAAGRGEYNLLASNDTPEGRSMNRRTRIIILPKLNQFYDLLNPEKSVANIN